MEFWIIASVAAACFQTVRFMLQKQLATGALSAAGATYARFVYSAPLLLLGLSLYFASSHAELPALSARFWMFAAIGGIAQIIATIATVMMFQERNFAVGVTLTKTEVLITVLTGFLILGDRVSLIGIAAIFLGLFGVILLSAKNDAALAFRNLSRRAATLALIAGVLFSISAVTYRGAALEVEVEQAMLRGAITLAAATSIQTLIMSLWLRLRERGEIARVFSAWRTAGLIGIFSLCGSWGWFTAFSLQNAAYVKALGQIEVVLSLAASALFFREAITRREVIGIGFMTASILGLIIFH